MTETVSRPPLSRAPRPRPASPLRVGLPAAAWALAVGLLAVAAPVLAAWAADARSGSGAAAALRAVGQVALLAHGAALQLPVGRLGLVPLGLVLVPLLLLVRAGRHAAERDGEVAGLRDAARLTLAIAAPYAVVVLALGALSETDDVRLAPVRAALAVGTVAVCGAGLGVLRAAGLLGALRARLGARSRRVLGAAAASALSLLGAGAVLARGSLAVHARAAADLAGGTGPGVVGGLVLLAVGLTLLPNAVVWGAGWLAGPGFAVGAGTAVGPFGTAVGPLPALPLLAAVPGGPVPLWVGVLALAVPVLAGAVGGLVLARRGGRWWEALLVGPVAGLLVALLAGLSGGPAGGDRLADLGPAPVRVGAAVALEVALGALLVMLVVRRRRARVPA